MPLPETVAPLPPKFFAQTTTPPELILAAKASWVPILVRVTPPNVNVVLVNPAM